MTPEDAAVWWKVGTFYQLYIPSFQDGNGDGFGDLWGVEQRIDYLSKLGVDAVWFSPFYDSPLLDFGYDVADYEAVGQPFGDLATFDRIVGALHERGMRILLDFVPQHTSDAHPWFQDALTGRDSEHRDWYIWADPSPDGRAPNNWASAFGGSAWTLHKPTGQYFYHAHLAQQPSLNWRNPEVKSAMFDAMRFWLRRGVDGFRVDAVWRLFKDQQLRDNPKGDEEGAEIEGAMAHSTVRQIQKFTADQPELPGALAEMRAIADEFEDRVLMGELHLAIERVAALGDKPGLDIPMNFSLIDVPWDGASIGQLITRYEAALTQHSWPNWTLGNHDRGRVASRLGVQRMPIAMVLLLTLRGTPTIYYGDELGLVNEPVAPGQERDCAALALPGQGIGRDPQRTPMPWERVPNVGFTQPGVEPWLPIPDPRQGRTVSEESADPLSLLNLVRELISHRHRHLALAIGAIDVLDATADHLVYQRSLNREVLIVVINFSEEATTLPLPPAKSDESWKVEFSIGHPELADRWISLPPLAACLLSSTVQLHT